MDVVPQYLKEVFVLKIRIKFAKRGPMKFISHLDVMRYFQKLNKRAGIDISYSEGFNPHQIMSFAAPLGVGLTSEGEYLDIDVKTTLSSADAIKALNSVSVENIPILSYRLLPENATKAMTLVAAADYFIKIKPGYLEDVDFDALIADFISKESVIITKETKKSTKEMDIRPLVYDFHKENEGYFIKLASGSADNLKPELVFKTLCEMSGKEMPEYALDITRLELYGYADENGKQVLKSLESFGDYIV